MIEVGQEAPDFTLPGVQNGVRRDYTLSELRGKTVVLAFYPGDTVRGSRRGRARHLPAGSRLPREVGCET